MFFVNIDSSGLDGLKGFESILKEAVQEAAQDLSVMTHAKAVELAGERLNSRRQMFVDALQLYEDQGVWVLQLDGKMTWVDDGLPPHNMLEDLLKSPKAQRAADGSSYVVVPFEHGPNKGATNTPASSMPMVEAAKNEMRRRKIPWAKVERDGQGRPKVGRLHSFSVMNKPAKAAEGPGQGHGPKGAVRQGPTGIPFLQGVAVYQHHTQDSGVKRSVMTFRIASSKHEGQGRWDHPGIEAINVIDDTYKWAMETVEKEIIPAMMRRLDERL